MSTILRTGALPSGATPTFQWSAAGGASHYQIQVDDEGGFPAPLLDSTTAATEYTMGTELDYRSYYWRVQAGNLRGSSAWPAPWLLIGSQERVYLPLVLR
jgi:hypothetical protein